VQTFLKLTWYLPATLQLVDDAAESGGSDEDEDLEDLGDSIDIEHSDGDNASGRLYNSTQLS